MKYAIEYNILYSGGSSENNIAIYDDVDEDGVLLQFWNQVATHFTAQGPYSISVSVNNLDDKEVVISKEIEIYSKRVSDKTKILNKIKDEKRK